MPLATRTTKGQLYNANYRKLLALRAHYVEFVRAYLHKTA